MKKGSAISDYWRRHLQGLRFLPFPKDWEPRPGLACDWATLECAVDAETKVQPFAAHFATWLILVQRYTGRADVHIATIMDRPEAAESSSTVSSPVLFRTTVDPARSFADLVRSVHEHLLAASHHSAVRIEEVLAEIFGEDDVELRHVTPLLFARSAAVERVKAAKGADNGWLPRLWATLESARLRLTYDRAALAPETASQLLADYSTLLRRGTAHGDRPIAELRMRGLRPVATRWSLTTPERFTPAPEPAPDESPVTRFRHIAREHAGCVAVVHKSASYTYEDVDALTDRVAARLHRQFGEGARLALLFGHEPGLVLAVLGALKARATYVPLDPRHPQTRLARIVATSRVDGLICADDLVTIASRCLRGGPIVTISDELAGRASLEAVPGPPEPPSTDLAYLLHTSGSTGLPKAVMQTRQGVLAHAVRYANRIRIGPGDRVPLLARCATDAAVMDLYGALLAGATLHIVDPYDGGVATVLARVAPTVLHCTPTLFRHLVTTLERNSAEPVDLRSVRVVVLGGEEVTGADVRLFGRHFALGTGLVNGFGPTECTLALQHLVVEGDARRSSVPIGHPVDGVEAILVDEDGLEAEVFGELVLRSADVALGYWNAPQATAAAFVTEPGRVTTYRTGDLARRLPDGGLVFCGRKDRQVKVRGHRLELGEPEALLRSHPTVAQAVVVLRENDGLTPELCAYVTSAIATAASSQELASYLRRHLPDHAVPTHVVILDDLPVGGTGKLDWSRLPNPAEISARPDPEEPRTDPEQAVARIWCEVLRIARAGVHDNFVASGGDSLNILHLLDRLQAELGIDIGLETFLRCPTIAGIVNGHQPPAAD